MQQTTQSHTGEKRKNANEDNGNDQYVYIAIADMRQLVRDNGFQLGIAVICAGFVREAAENYERRKKLKGDN